LTLWADLGKNFLFADSAFGWKTKRLPLRYARDKAQSNTFTVETGFLSLLVSILIRFPKLIDANNFIVPRIIFVISRILELYFFNNSGETINAL